jgi:hypothetical protein
VDTHKERVSIKKRRETEGQNKGKTEDSEKPKEE